MLALTILLFGLLLMLIIVVALLVVARLYSLLPLVVPLVPMLMAVGSFLLGMIELLLLFGGPDEQRLAKKELKYLGAAFAISLALWWVSTQFLWKS